MAHEPVVRTAVDDPWPVRRGPSSGGLHPAPAEGQIPAGPGGGDPAAIYAALSHFTDEDSTAHVKLQPDGRASDDAIARMKRGHHLVGDGDSPPAGPVPSDTGFLTAELATKIDGKDVKLPKGTVVVVQVVRKDNLLAKVYSGYGGKEVEVPVGSFKAEPALTKNKEPEHADEPRDYIYQEYTSQLWDGAPKVTDVAQGSIGDCYLMAAMGAVAAANPNAIKKLFSPQTPNATSYTVSLYVRNRDGSFAKHPITVDTNLPTKREDIENPSPTYALKGKAMSDHKTPIWPALLEKAYAQLMGGYDIIGQGGPPERAMEALTGVASKTEETPAKNSDALARFKEYQKAGAAVVCGTLDSKHAASKTPFKGAGDGPYTGTLMTSQGEPATIVEGTLSIHDKQGHSASDDSSGKVTGGGIEGTVKYDKGEVSLKFSAGKGPAKPGDIRADYDWKGTLDKGLNVHANHAYIFESVTPDNKLQFRNPWGDEHPKPMTVADFKRLFDTGIDSNPVPKG